MTTPPPKDPLDKMLHQLKLGISLSSKAPYPIFDDSVVEHAFNEAKQQILTHYISYEELDRLLGKAEKPDIRLGDNSYIYSAEAEIRNIYKAELKAALNKRRESK